MCAHESDQEAASCLQVWTTTGVRHVRGLARAAANVHVRAAANRAPVRIHKLEDRR